jgi:predicted nuclease of predicted toxin-antitoxin system
MASAEDEAIFDRAGSEARVVISADADFGTLLSLRQTSTPLLILLRRLSGRRPKEQVAVLLANLANIAGELEEGSVVVFDEKRIRVRPLPIVKTRP